MMKINNLKKHVLDKARIGEGDGIHKFLFFKCRVNSNRDYQVGVGGLKYNCDRRRYSELVIRYMYVRQRPLSTFSSLPNSLPLSLSYTYTENLMIDRSWECLYKRHMKSRSDQKLIKLNLYVLGAIFIIKYQKMYFVPL